MRADKERPPLPVQKSDGHRLEADAKPRHNSPHQSSQAPDTQDHCARLIVHRTEPVQGRRHVYLYSVEYQGDLIVERSADAACDAARALKARGISGRFTMLDGVTGVTRLFRSSRNISLTGCFCLSLVAKHYRCQPQRE